MKPILFICIIFLCLTKVSAQISNILPTATTTAGAAVAETTDWSAFANPASIGYIPEKLLNVQYENRYFIPELSTKSIGLVLPSKLINTSFSASYFGYAEYNQMLFGIGFSRNFDKKFSIGVQFDYLTAFFITPGRHYGAFFPQIGLNLSLSPDFHLGFSTFNPFQTVIKSDQSKMLLPSVFSIGTEYFLSEDFVVYTQFDKEISSNYRLTLGTEYSMLHFLTVKLGLYHAGYLVPCFGFQTNSSSFTFQLNEELHPILGLVSIATLQYRFKKSIR